MSIILFCNLLTNLGGIWTKWIPDSCFYGPIESFLQIWSSYTLNEARTKTIISDRVKVIERIKCNMFKLKTFKKSFFRKRGFYSPQGSILGNSSFCLTLMIKNIPRINQNTLCWLIILIISIMNLLYVDMNRNKRTKREHFGFW